MAVAVYGFAVFSGAFLLFQVQPIIGKFILPWFGGAPAVWTTCLLFFQILLLGGYGYAYLSARWLKPRAQVVVHIVFLAAAIATLPITPDSSWKPQTLIDPTLRICALLGFSLGLPFFVLSATAPLLQNWFRLTQSGVTPFRLYALSNMGSLLALLSYPILVERWLSRANQTLFWSVGLVTCGLSCAIAGFLVWRTAGRPVSTVAPEKVCPPATGDLILWLLFPACSSLLLLAVTNKICQDLAPIALLWVLPLSVYLLSFVLCFNSARLYHRSWFGPLLLLCLVVAGAILSGAVTFSAQAQVLVFLATLFICCLVCHGEVYRLRPGPIHLTLFYLIISAGGALGGVFVALIAPRIFSDFFEFHLGLVTCGGLFLFALARASFRLRSSWLRFAWLGGVAALVGLAFVLWKSIHLDDALRVYRSRNFYGVLNVYRHEFPNPAGNLIELVHGRVAHGVQFLQSARSRTPTLYYSVDSGVGKALAVLAQKQRRVGVIGLGAGTIAAYMRLGDEICFYEINPEVEKIARKYFTFLGECAGGATVVLGDARLSLENEPDQNFDLLALDAFNSDAIPVHLLTREAFAVYQRHLKPDGVLAIHVSNLSLNLEPVVQDLAREFGYDTQVVDQPKSDEAEGILPSSWMLLSRNSQFIHAPTIAAASRPSVDLPSKGKVWTDEFNGLFAVIRWRELIRGRDDESAGVSRPRPVQPIRADAITQLREAVAHEPNSPILLNNLACLLATASDPALRNGPEAVKLAEKACALTAYQNTSTLSTLATAYAEAGRFDEAVATAEKACAMATQKGEQSLLVGNRRLLEYFRNHRPFHLSGP
jgi:hypothetical protein